MWLAVKFSYCYIRILFKKIICLSENKVFVNILNRFLNECLRFLVFDALEANDTKAYVKKPKPGKASKPFHNKKPPATTRGNKRFRPDTEVEDEFAGQSPAPPPNTGSSKKFDFFGYMDPKFFFLFEDEEICIRILLQARFQEIY